MVQIRVDKYDTIDKIEKRMQFLQHKLDQMTAEYAALEEKHYDLKKPGFKIPKGGFKDDKQSKETGKNSSSSERSKQETDSDPQEKEKITGNIKKNHKNT